ncbi:MAG: DUF4416 family protein [bacterium]|nr:DUF4416 family protein [bacterium]
MAQLNFVEPVLLFIGVIFSKQDDFSKVREILESKYGKIILFSDNFLFEGTSYYEKEMGGGLLKNFFAFETLIKQSSLAEIKNFSNELETLFSDKGKRYLNIDPGYLNLSKVVLASCKDFAHRIYIGKHIFAEITLSYTKGAYMVLPWTYPDFKNPEYLEFFYKGRKLYTQALHCMRTENNEETNEFRG